MKIVGIIPARYKSSRFEGKPLADICGKPMIWWVYQQVKKVKRINEVYVATDDIRIQETCIKYGINSIMTSENIGTSTERLYEISLKVDADLYVCINGDEPLVQPDIIETIIPVSKPQEPIYVANLMTPINDPVGVVDNTNIKVVVDYLGNALFMSRNPIPYPKSSLNYRYHKHVGIIIYNKAALHFFKSTKKGINELIEDVNELRFIENGVPLRMIPVITDTLSVDTPKDLEKVRQIISSKLNNDKNS